jgi:hypothetical protein
MNIFKVLASGKNKFSEEVSSAMLAWLLNPNMEHGLGSVFLAKFIESLSLRVEEGSARDELRRLSACVEPILRTDGRTTSVDFELLLEMGLKTDFIDIVLRIDKWWISIENKIHEGSINREKLQVRQQYDGLRALVSQDYGDDHRILSVFLVPSVECASNPLVRAERDAMSAMRAGDHSVLLSWQAGSEGDGETPSQSIIGILREILREEQGAETEPLAEYLRHTLKAFAIFIDNGFGGYPYERQPRKSGLNEKTDAQLNLDAIKKSLAGSDEKRVRFVGVSAEESGLLRMSREEIGAKVFQTSTSDMSNRRNWIDVQRFVGICDWLRGGTKPVIEWRGKFPARLLLRIAEGYEDDVCIGVQGGSAALEVMSQQTIQGKNWKIAMGKPGNSNWIPGTQFAEILQRKEKGTVE